MLDMTLFSTLKSRLSRFCFIYATLLRPLLHNRYLKLCFYLTPLVLIAKLTVSNITSNYTMHNKFSNCFVWVSPSTSDLKFHLLS